MLIASTEIFNRVGVGVFDKVSESIREVGKFYVIGGDGLRSLSKTKEFI